MQRMQGVDRVCASAQVYKLGQGVRVKYEETSTSRISDDPSDAVSTEASETPAERYGPI